VKALVRAHNENVRAECSRSGGDEPLGNTTEEPGTTDDDEAPAEEPQDSEITDDEAPAEEAPEE
jgi:hypothetical protein